MNFLMARFLDAKDGATKVKTEEPTSSSKEGSATPSDTKKAEPTDSVADSDKSKTSDSTSDASKKEPSAPSDTPKATAKEEAMDTN